MAVPKLFSIEEMARLFHLSVSSLRHYEALGLLRPEKTDPDTGYRYYSTRQFEVLNTIRYLRALDMPLTEIAGFLHNRDVDNIEEKLRRQKEAVIARQRELQRIERKIDNRLRGLCDARSSQLHIVRPVRCPACRIVRMEKPLRITGALDIEAPIRQLAGSQAEAVVFLGKVGVGLSAEHLCAGQFAPYDSLFLLLDEEDHFDGEIQTLPEAVCVTLRFCGSHTEAPAQYRILMEYIREHRLTVTGFSREITMIDYGITGDPDQFVTEIAIPVAGGAAADSGP